MLLRLTEKTFYPNSLSTIGVSYKSTTYKINSKNVRLRIWDTAGQEIFRSMTKSYYRGAYCAILVYDITNSDTFGQLYIWIKEVKELAKEDLVLILVGNKVDLEEKREISTEKGQNLADENNMLFFETSAKTGKNIEEVFLECAQTTYKKYSKGVWNTQSKEENNEKILPKEINFDDNNKKSCC
ncbi:ras and ef-hand domain-containing protein [Anaeramoeba flamelloides]|nr:ras and ef-hand domain-containing protein [Anaeramoeba flamelloides]